MLMAVTATRHRPGGSVDASLRRRTAATDVQSWKRVTGASFEGMKNQMARGDSVKRAASERGGKAGIGTAATEGVEESATEPMELAEPIGGRFLGRNRKELD